MTIQEIIDELKAVDTTELDLVVAAVDKATADLSAFVAPATPDPVTQVSVTQASGAVSTFPA